MKISTRGLLAIPALAIALTAGHTTFAQNKPKKTPPRPAKIVPDKNRVTDTKLGISYIAPQEYNPTKPVGGSLLTLEGPRPAAMEGAANYVSNNVHYTLDRYLRTLIVVIRQPDSAPPMGPLPTTPEAAKNLLAVINNSRVLGGNPLNYQNSAAIRVDGHDALAVLSEVSVPGMSARSLVRLILLVHRQRLYVFQFNTVDDEFETRVPAFESFVNSLKFTQPDTTMAEATPKPGPVEIKIDH